MQSASSTAHESPAKNRAQLILQLKKNANSVNGTIKKRHANQAALLSSSQERLWIMSQLEPDSSIYNMAGAMQLDGALNTVALQQCLNEVLRRHEILRTRFVEKNDQVIQRVTANATLLFSQLDLSASEQAPHLFELCARYFVRQPFNLSKQLPVRVLLTTLNAQQHILLLSLHHIVADRWSVSVLMQEVAALYALFSQGLPSTLTELPIQYADFSAWQRQQNNSAEKHLLYWQQKLKNAPPLLTLPTDRPRPPVQSYHGAVLAFAVPQPLSATLAVLARQQNVTLFMLMSAAFSLLLSRYSHQKDLTIGYPMAGRHQAQTSVLIGFFVNTLVLRCTVQNELPFSQYLKQIRDQALQDQAHSELAFGQLVEAINPVRHAEHAPLFQVMLAVQNVPTSTLQLADLTVTPLSLHNDVAQFDLTLFIEQSDGKLQGLFEYNTDLFDAATIANMAEQLYTLLASIVRNPNAPLKHLSLLTTQQQQQLLAWQAPAPIAQPLLIHQMFENLATSQPDKLALVFAEQTLTYGELNQRANQLAHYLRAQGIRAESRVGVSAERSAELIIALLAVLKVGAAYIPLDPSYPQQRLDYIIADAGIDLLLTQTDLLAKFPSQRTVCIDQVFVDYPTWGLHSDISVNNTAYVIYTSGSTGQPKGVLISHGNLLHSTLARNDYYQDPLSCFLLLSSFAFDSSVAGLFWTLSQGGCLCLPQADDLSNPTALAKLIQQHEVSHLLALPSFYAALISDKNLPLLTSLKTVIVAGEACSTAIANDHHHKLPAVKFYNEYGPTEGSVWSSVYHSIGLETGAVLSIGQAINNVQIVMMDSLGQVVPVGVSGELCIAGAGLASAYLNQASLTAEKFIPHPYAAGQRLYRTGDLGRYRANGTIEFLGRVDHQVKIRGYRIELSEIETRLLQHPAIHEVAVLAKDDVTGHKRLCAYLVANPAAVSESDIAQHLKQTLPDYMLPSVVMYLDALPLTPNGKLNRTALPIPQQRTTQHFKQPSNSVEEFLVIAWREVLGVEAISINDNFFALGGHSLAAIQVRSRINELFNVDMPAKILFETPTIEGIAKEILALQALQQDDDALELLLKQLEQLSDEEALALLND